mmetsp:Transcript_50407/g.122932  ORF Transcript_50407/g.122932 Transcript_50407/m.122932 type:complete len:367 (+) Transcript_50407:442-1542(+)
MHVVRARGRLVNRHAELEVHNAVELPLKLHLKRLGEAPVGAGHVLEALALADDALLHHVRRPLELAQLRALLLALLAEAHHVLLLLLELVLQLSLLVHHHLQRLAELVRDVLLLELDGKLELLQLVCKLLLLLLHRGNPLLLLLEHALEGLLLLGRVRHLLLELVGNVLLLLLEPVLQVDLLHEHLAELVLEGVGKEFLLLLDLLREALLLVLEPVEVVGALLELGLHDAPLPLLLALLLLHLLLPRPPLLLDLLDPRHELVGDELLLRLDLALLHPHLPLERPVRLLQGRVLALLNLELLLEALDHGRLLGRVHGRHLPPAVPRLQQMYAPANEDTCATYTPLAPDPPPNLRATRIAWAPPALIG